MASAPGPAPSPPGGPALALAGTIRHDGRGGVADDLTTPAGLTAWVRAHAEALRGALDADGFTAGPDCLEAVRELRAAVRALFARAVHPAPPSAADAGRLPAPDEALARLNAAAALAPSAPSLHWPPGTAAPSVRTTAPAGLPPGDLLTAALARDAIAFLAGPGRERLRSCQGPRCAVLRQGAPAPGVVQAVLRQSRPRRPAQPAPGPVGAMVDGLPRAVALTCSESSGYAPLCGGSRRRARSSPFAVRSAP